MAESINIARIVELMRETGPDGTDHHDLYDVERGSSSAIELETALLLYALVRRTRPLTVVETGTHKGWSSAWIASALADNYQPYPHLGKPRLYTVDSNAYEGKPEVLWATLGVEEFITHKVTNSWDVNFELGDRKIDFLWLDSDHSGETIVREFSHFRSYLADELLVAFHDTWTDTRMGRGIDVIKNVCLPAGYSVSHVALRNMRGFDFFQLHKGIKAPRPDAQWEQETLEGLTQLAGELR